MEASSPKASREAGDLVVIGASAGGLQPISQLLSSLPSTFPAAICVVLHLPPTPSTVLCMLLDRVCHMPARNAQDGELLEPSQVYVAPPDHHLRIAGNRAQLSRGPRENNHRPALDPLFRSAAQCYGPRAIGVVLSGTRDDGTEGLRAIKLAGGVTVVQDPNEAQFSSMPRNALEHSPVDHCVSIERMSVLLQELVPCARGPRELRKGPAATPSMFAADVQEALWCALRVLRSDAKNSRDLAERARSRNLMLMANACLERADESNERAHVIEKLLAQTCAKDSPLEPRPAPVQLENPQIGACPGPRNSDN